MATRVKYKFGDDEFDLKDYIHNLETNYQSYVASKNWNEGQQQEFKNAFDKYLTGLKDQLSNNTGRFYTDYSGAIFDNKGEFSNTDDDNIDPVGSEYYYNNKGQRITTDDYNLLRKRKQKNFNTFSANRQVATYLNKVGIALRDYSKQNPSNNSSNAFNLSKHGFEKYWMDQNNPSGGDFDFAPYVEKDQIGEGGVRGTSNRAAYLKEQLENYIKNLGDYDFSSTTFKDKDTYLAKLRAAMENLDNGYNHEDAIALNQAGLSSSFLNNFFGTGEQQQKSEVEQVAEYIAAEQKRQQDQEIIDQAARMKAMSELDQWAKDNQFQPKYSGVLEGGDYDPDAILSMLEKDYADIEGDDNKVKAWLNFEQLLKDIREPMIEADAIINGQPVSTIEGSKAAMRKLRANLAQKLKFAAQEGYMKAYGDEYIIPGSEDYSNYSLITYNPVTGEYKDQSVILNEKLREAMAYDWYKKNTSVPSNKNGGALYYLQQGGFMQRQREVRKQREEQQKQEQTQQSTKSKDEDTRTPEQRKAGERVPKSGELSTIDKVKIGSAIADIGSILAAFVPGYGTAASAIAGLGSTGANLYADISDDSVSGWQAAGNAGFGLLMDVAGLIPGLGAVGKAGKIAKTLKYVLPTALTIWGVSENGGDAIKAANKLMNGQDLTVDDWKALSFGLQTIAGGTRAKNTSVPSNKNGGALYYLQQGGFMQRQREVRKQREEQQKQEQTQQSTKSKDEDTRTPEQRKAGERVPKSGELSTIDKVKIGSAIADIGSILAAFVPGYGTAASAIAGLGSTGANLYADISDDSVSGWQAAGNAGFGLLMDVAGLIPGLGAVGKAGKIAKTLKYVLPTALTIWGVSENGGDAIKAANKLMNGQDLTVDDWKALSFGLQTIAGGTRAVKGNKSVNRQLKNTKEKAPYKTITAESGKTYKVTPEQFKQITSATTLEAQNKAFREAIGSRNSSERLGSKFKTSRWERVRHPFTAEPKTGGGVDYIDRSLDISTMERIPWQFKVNNGQLTPRRLSNEWLLQKTGRWTFGDPTINWFTRKNPLYNKLVVPQSSAPTVSTPQIKSSIRPGSGPNIRQLRMWNRTPGYARAQGYGRDFGVGDTRNSREISLGIEFDKQGGILKYQDGNVLTPTGRAGVRKKDTYTFNTTNRLQSVLNKIKKGEITVDDANEFQRRHYTMYSQWTQQPMQGQSVSLYQTDYNNQGWNDEIIAPGFTNNYDIQSTNPTSGDSIVGNWTIDGIYDQITDDRRVMARDSDYKDQASRDADIKLAEQAGFEYYLDPETRYWMLKEKPRKDEGQVSPPRQVSEPVKNEPVAEEEPIVENSKANNNILRTILGNPTITYGLPRAVYADRMNRRMTDLAKESVTPLLKDPFQVHRYTRSDLDAEMQGERNYADLRRLASRPITSDGSLQTATQLQAEVQGQEARTAGKEKSNQTQRQYDELAWQQEKENAANRHETAMFNRAQQWGADQDKSKFEQAYLSKKFNIWDTFGQQLEFEARSRQQESKAIAYRFAYSDIQNAVNSDPNRYGAGLTEEELALHKRLQAGIAPSQLISENNNNVTLLFSIRQKLSQAQQAQLSQYYNINPSKWAGVRSAQKPQEIIITRAARKGAKLAKNGSKIAIAGIEAKTADAERFQRQIKDCIDRNEKTLDRLSKSLYDL